MADGGVANHDLDLTVQPDNTPGLCVNDVNKDCCSCYKRATDDYKCLGKDTADKFSNHIVEQIF